MPYHLFIPTRTYSRLRFSRLLQLTFVLLLLPSYFVFPFSPLVSSCTINKRIMLIHSGQAGTHIVIFLLIEYWRVPRVRFGEREPNTSGTGRFN
jgi:hypothetical protein